MPKISADIESKLFDITRSRISNPNSKILFNGQMIKLFKTELDDDDHQEIVKAVDKNRLPRVIMKRILKMLEEKTAERAMVEPTIRWIERELNTPHR